jgi:hypothetical protein
MRKVTAFLIVSVIFLSSIFTIYKLIFIDKSKVYYEKTDESYIVYYVGKDGNTKFEQKLPAQPNIINHSKDMIEVRISSGNPANYSFFIDLKTERISQEFELILAVKSSSPFLVAVPMVDSVYVYDIFNPTKEISAIKRDFSPSATVYTVIQKAEFVNNNKLYIRYFKGKDYEVVEERINIPENKH